MLIDWLITGQVLPTNPAAAVRGRNHVVKTGKTPVLEGAERRAARLHSGHCAARFARPGIDRHVEDLNRPYGLAWRDDGLLVADQDGIWRVPTLSAHSAPAVQYRRSAAIRCRPISGSRCRRLWGGDADEKSPTARRHVRVIRP
jgi:hypothetical protein